MVSTAHLLQLCRDRYPFGFSDQGRDVDLMG